MIRVVHHQRRSYPEQVSIERLFDGIRNELLDEFNLATATSPNFSKGFWPRWCNIQFASQQEADIHHIVGDAHYLAFGLPPVKLVLTIHDCAALNRLHGFKRILLKYFWFTGPMRRAAAVTTISNSTKIELAKWVGILADKVRVIPNCVGPEFVSTPKEFNSKSPIVLQVGTGWNKNLERVAEALRGTSCSLEIVGKMSDLQRQRVTAIGIQYRELGRLDDEELVVAYQRCDLVMFASLYEGFGLPIIEAQAAGRPIVTSKRSSMPEVAGDGALFVEPESVESIREAVTTLVQEPMLRNRLVEQGFQNVRRFQPQAIAAQYAALYREVAHVSETSL